LDFKAFLSLYIKISHAEGKRGVKTPHSKQFSLYKRIHEKFTANTAYVRSEIFLHYIISVFTPKAP